MLGAGDGIGGGESILSSLSVTLTDMLSGRVT